MARNSSLGGLACPGCRADLCFHGYLSSGYLECQRCGVFYPALHGFSYFDQPTMNPLVISDETNFLKSLESLLIGDEVEYLAFLKSKRKRPAYDAYAAFQPFNESTRALFALLDEIKKHVGPGQPILDLWGRTAWSGEVLASYFPENPVYMIWEGNRNVLGYRGYHYWLPESKRLKNLHVVFSDLEKPLPFKDSFFGFIHGLDTFHRYSHNPFIAEVFRVAKSSAPIIFPHIHLTNSEPNPYFDRGCMQYHGSVYRKLFDRLTETQQRRFYLLSEKTLFESRSSATLTDDWNMQHYNALLYVAPEGVLESQLGSCDWPQVELGASTQMIMNPLVKVDALIGIASIQREAMEGFGHEMLNRHPLYEDCLRRCLPYELDGTQRKIIYCIEQGLPVLTVAEYCGLSLEALQEKLLILQDKEICTFVNISESMAQLQRFYSTQTLIDSGYSSPSFGALWSECLSQNSEWAVFVSPAQDIEYALDDVQEIVEKIRHRIINAGLQPNDRVLLCAEQHPEYLMTIWAAWLQGLTVVPVSSDWGLESIEYVMERTNCKLIFLGNDSNLDMRLNVATVYFDSLDESTLEPAPGCNRHYFSDWLDEVEADSPLSDVDEINHAVAILFTSGTTGEPKGVVHSFSSLYRGCYKLSTHYDLDEHKSLMSFGGFHSMSGLRNAAVLGLYNKQTVVLNDSFGLGGVNALIESCSSYSPNIVFSTPALIESLELIEDRLDKEALSGLAVWLCTGASVSNSRLYQLGRRLSIRFESYYGLTETGGFCAGTNLSENTEIASIGVPAGAILELENSEGKICRENVTGNLKVYSDQLMLGYVTAENTLDDLYKDSGGWYDTGDLAYVNNQGEVILQGRNDEQFKTPAGDCVNLSHLEAIVKDQYKSLNFSLTHNNNALNAFIECANECFISGQYDNEISELINALRINSGVTLGHIEVSSVEKIPVNKNGKIERNKLKNLAFGG